MQGAGGGRSAASGSGARALTAPGRGAQVSWGVRFQRAGSLAGPPAVFLPGAGWTGAEGLAVAEALPQFSWYCLDLPGTGGSAPLTRADAHGFAAWLRAFCEQAGTGPVHLAGHSLGGYLALAAAATDIPLRSLLLIDGGIGPFVVPQEVGPVAYLAPAIACLDALAGGALIARRPGPPASPEPPEDPAELARRFGIPQSEALRQAALDAPWPQQAWNLDGRAVQRLALIGLRLRQRQALASLKVPTLELLARHPRGPAWIAKIVAGRRSLLKAVANVQVTELDTGHYPFWEDPRAFRQAAGRFYDGLGR